MVSPVTFRHPAELAKAVVTADHVSGGRVELGMGAGWFEREHRAFGFPFPPTRERMDMLTEQVEIVHRLWGADGDQVDFEGEHYRLEACPALPTPYQDPHPPLIIGGGAGPRSAALAARWADEYDVVYANPARAKERFQRISAACESDRPRPRGDPTIPPHEDDRRIERGRGAPAGGGDDGLAGRGRRRRGVPRRPPRQPCRRNRRAGPRASGRVRSRRRPEGPGPPARAHRSRVDRADRARGRSPRRLASRPGS